MEEKKYRLIEEETIEVGSHTLYRIEALRDFSDVKAGDKGGFIEHEDNLSHEDNCWVYDDAKVYDNAMVFIDAVVFEHAKVCGDVYVCENAKVYGNAMVYDNAEVCGDTRVCGESKVSGNAKVYGNACLYGNAKVEATKDYIVFKNWWSSGRYFTWTRSNNMWRVGCFYGTGEELIKKAYKDSEQSGREYERVVKYVEEILSEEQASIK